MTCDAESKPEPAKLQKLRQDEGNHLGNLGNAYARLGDAKKAITLYEQPSRSASAAKSATAAAKEPTSATSAFASAKGHKKSDWEKEKERTVIRHRSPGADWVRPGRLRRVA